eukprot:672122-Amphidinium_carterae.1
MFCNLVMCNWQQSNGFTLSFDKTGIRNNCAVNAVFWINEWLPSSVRACVRAVRIGEKVHNPSNLAEPVLEHSEEQELKHYRHPPSLNTRHAKLEGAADNARRGCAPRHRQLPSPRALAAV